LPAVRRSEVPGRQQPEAHLTTCVGWACFLWQLGEGEMRMVATNGHRLVFDGVARKGWLMIFVAGYEELD